MNQKDHDRARKYLERSLAISIAISNRFVAGVNLNELGALALAQTDIPLAESHYQEALDIRRELNRPVLCAEDRAGLAQVKLAQGDRMSARQYGEEVLAYLQENPRLDGAENRLRAFRFTWEVLHALGQSSDAEKVLSLGAQIMEKFLVKNGDPDSQELYLRQLHHSVLWEAWKAKGNDLDEGCTIS